MRTANISVSAWVMMSGTSESLNSESMVSFNFFFLSLEDGVIEANAFRVMYESKWY